MLQFLTGLLGENRVLTEEPMKKHTTFRIGGNARFLVMVETKQELITLISYLEEQKQAYYILGNGSNLLVSDEGYDGVMVKLRGDFLRTELVEQRVNLSEASFEKCSQESPKKKDENQPVKRMIKVGAGALLSSAAYFAQQNGLAKMEFASGIPGTIGGALVMNAGAYGGEMSQIVHRVEILEDGEIHSYFGEEMDFGYRWSRLKKNPGVVLFAELLLEEGCPEEILAKMEEYKKQRIEKQPLELPSAGSTFKRPEGYFAGKLIMDAGLKGYRVGDAMVSEKHAGFVVNMGNASAKDVKQLMQDVSDKVYEKYQVRLEPEVIVL